MAQSRSIAVSAIRSSVNYSTIFSRRLSSNARSIDSAISVGRTLFMLGCDDLALTGDTIHAHRGEIGGP
jgi:hypothetical protein